MTPVTSDAPELGAWYARSASAVLAHLRSNPQTGLTQTQAEHRLRACGPNAFRETSRRSRVAILLDQFRNVMLLLLIGVAFISGALDVLALRAGNPEGVPFKDAIAILVIVALNGILGYLQENRAEEALAALRQLSAPHARVRRDGRDIEIDAPELVPGDIVYLEAGEQVPADARLLMAAGLQVREAALTGEAVPVYKHANAEVEVGADLGDHETAVYAGTDIVQGRATAVITATGHGTELGRIATMLESVETTRTPLQRRMSELSSGLVTGALLLVAVTIAVGAIEAGFGALRELVEVSLSMAVAVVPEGLPAVITVTLAIGTQRMVRRNTLIRRLPAVETLGSVSAICSDKTGTLTQNKMVVQQVVTSSGRFQVGGNGYVPEGDFSRDGMPIAPADVPELQALLVAIAACNDATLEQTGEPPEWTVRGDPTEGALLALSAKAEVTRAALAERYERLDERPFDAERKRMSVLCHPLDADGDRVVFAKGSPESLLDCCSAVQVGLDAQAIAPETGEAIRAANEDLARQGLRVLGVAYRTAGTLDLATAESDLVWLGAVGMLDAPRPEVRAAVDTCRRAGIRTIAITGDHQLTARAIAEQLGIARPQDKLLTGKDLEALSDLDLEEIVEQTSVYARVTPEHKLRIVEALQRRGQFVAMTGDGVNDAPALKRADIGIAMGITGTEVSKEASDAILLDDNFASIVAAAAEGRAIYANIRRFIKYILGSNVGEVLSIAAAPLLGLSVPLTPLQILYMNLVTDGVPALALAVEPADPDLMLRPPHKPQESIFARGLGLYIVRIGIVFAVITIALMSRAHEATRGSASPEAWKTMVFTMLCLSQMGHALAVRSERPIWTVAPFSNPSLLVAIAATTVLQILLIYLPPLQSFFGTYPLSLSQLAVCVGVSTLLFVWVELEKLFLRWWRSR